jgi:predicted DNA-binding protein with PD1-like motif
MRTLPIRLAPGVDLRRALEAEVAGQGCEAAFVLGGIGSLSQVQIRLADAAQVQARVEPLEVLTLSGTVGVGASHLHATLARADGSVFGGHLGYGSTVRTTAEVLLALLDGWSFTREADAGTGYAELVVRARE